MKTQELISYSYLILYIVVLLSKNIIVYIYFLAYLNIISYFIIIIIKYLKINF